MVGASTCLRYPGPATHSFSLGPVTGSLARRLAVPATQSRSLPNRRFGRLAFLPQDAPSSLRPAVTFLYSAATFRACYGLPECRSFAPTGLFRFLWQTQGGARASARPLPSSLFPTASSALGCYLLGFQPLGDALRPERSIFTNYTRIESYECHKAHPWQAPLSNCAPHRLFAACRRTLPLGLCSAQAISLRSVRSARFRLICDEDLRLFRVARSHRQCSGPRSP
jgi:hypothetical protein